MPPEHEIPRLEVGIDVGDCPDLRSSSHVAILSSYGSHAVLC